MNLRPAPLFLAAIGLLAACWSVHDDPRILRVALQTDLGPAELAGASFAFAVRRLDDDPASMPRLTRTLTLDELDPAPADLPGEGLRSRVGVRALVAEGLPEGRYEVEVTVSGVDPPRSARTAAFSLIGVRDLTLSLLTEPDVTCMVDGDCVPPPCAEGECWSGLCAALRDPDAPEECECDEDADCSRGTLGLSDADCRTARCAEQSGDDGTRARRCVADPTASACPSGATCAASAATGVFACTTVTCEGRAPGDVCRPAAGDCDVAEVCGEGAECPPDAFTAVGTPCTRPAGLAAGACDGLGACVGPDPECTSDADCDDTFACTDDRCDGGACSHVEQDGPCVASSNPCVDRRECAPGAPGHDVDGCVDRYESEGASCGNTEACTRPDTCDGLGACVVDATPLVCPGSLCAEGNCGCVPGPAGNAACQAVFGQTFPGTCELLPSADPCSTAGVERRTVRTSFCHADGTCRSPADMFMDVPCVVPSEGRTCGDTTTTTTACLSPDASGECPTVGTRTETRTSRVCRSGACTVESAAVNLSCSLPSDGLPCGPPLETTSACDGFSATNRCDDMGFATRTVIRSLCNAGTCDPDRTSSTSTTVSCSRNTDGWTCDLDPCSPGECAFGYCLAIPGCVAPCICTRLPLSSSYGCALDPRSGRDLGMSECVEALPID